MMLDSPHTSAPMLMWGKWVNTLVLKTPVKNAQRTSIEKHLTRSLDIPPAGRFPPHRSRPAGYPPNRQPATVGEEERGWRGTTSSRTTTGRAPELSPTKSLSALGIQSSSPAPGATSPWDSELGAIEDSISQCTCLQMTYTPRGLWLAYPLRCRGY